MAEQGYRPYRGTLLSKSDLAALNQLRPGKAMFDVGLLWLQIAAAWFVAAHTDSWWVTVIAAAIVGNRYYSLYIIGHDGLHRRLHNRTRTNDFINDVFILGAIGAITRLNRRNHMRHHASLNTDADPDAYKYASRTAMPAPAFWFSLTGVPFVLRAVANVFGAKQSISTAPQERYNFRDLAVIILWQAGLFTGLTLAFGWWGYFVMWATPVYVFTFAADVARVFCEHSTHGDGSLPTRLVTFDGNWLELALFAPRNMNHHTAHHLWPSIPYYHLPEATAAIRARCTELQAEIEPTTFRYSYVRYLVRYLVADAPVKS